MAGVFKKTEKGLLLSVRLIPFAAKDQVVGIEKNADGAPHLKVKVRAVPEKGKANKALEGFLAKSLGLPKSSFEVISGQTSRAKKVLITADPKEIRARFKTLIEKE